MTRTVVCPIMAETPIAVAAITDFAIELYGSAAALDFCSDILLTETGNTAETLIRHTSTFFKPLFKTAPVSDAKNGRGAS